MTLSLIGQLGWAGGRDPDGHRNYRIQWLVSGDPYLDGPSSILAFTDGTSATLPGIGSTWTFGSDNDTWAYCWPDWKMEPFQSRPGEPSGLWSVEQNFTTRPLARCMTTTIESPLSEPFKISGSFIQYTKQATSDYAGNSIRNSAMQRITGPEVEIDASRANVKIVQNLATLPLATATHYLHNINDATMWGMSAHCVKFSNMTFQRVLYSVCTFYYIVEYDFDIKFDTFDSQIHDFGTMILQPGGASTNPAHYAAYKDLVGENQLIPLNGSGGIWNGSGIQPYITVQFYPQANLVSILGLPSSF